MAPVKVFGPAMSTNVVRVLVCLEEVGAEYEVVNIDMKSQEHKSPQHLVRNVRPQPPCLSLNPSPASSFFLDSDDRSSC
jgi:glutathione S-transferase